ncbi:MAG: hypothetical protein IH599_00750, partial [Bacteroidales bacterium]|nr:hypothetical protein [Bacteroidales bacterium]
MKTLILALIFLIAGSSLIYSQGLDTIIVERYYVSDTADSLNSDGILPVGSITYRVFVDMAPGFKLLAVYGTAEHHLFMQTTTSFFNNEFFGSKTPTFSKPVLGFNSMMLDSWVSMGAACSGYSGVLKTEDDGVATVVNMNGMMQNNDPLAGIPVSVQDGMVQATPASVTTLGLDNALTVLDDVSQAGNLVYVTDGVWASLGGAQGPYPSNRVLIAQLTTDGVLSFELNIQIQDTLSLAEYRFVAKNPTGNEVMYPALTYSSNLPPQVVITSPSNTAIYTMGSVVTIEASASDMDGSVEQVDFYVDGNLIGMDSTSPFSYDYLSTAGTHILHCVAYDDMGDSAISATVTINVTTGFDIPEFAGHLNVFPNPVQDIMQLSLLTDEHAALSYRLTDVLGQEIMAASAGVITGEYRTSIDFQKYPSGIYILELT